MIIAFVGPDGSGKSTIAKLMAKRDNRAIYIYLGHGKERQYILSKLSKKLLNIKFLGRGLKLLDDMLTIFKLKLSKNKLYIVDRWIIDFYIQSENRFKKFIFFHFFKLLPKPDIFILLSGKPEEIFQRKKEIQAEIIRKQISDYKRALSKYNLLIIDTTLTSPIQAVEIIQEKIEVLKGR